MSSTLSRCCRGFLVFSASVRILPRCQRANNSRRKEVVLRMRDGRAARVEDLQDEVESFLDLGSCVVNRAHGHRSAKENWCYMLRGVIGR